MSKFKARPLGVVALSGLLALAAGSGLANAAETPTDIDGSPQNVALTASVDVLPQCVWFLANVDTSVGLVSADVDPMDPSDGKVKYIGEELPLSGADEGGIDVYLTGDQTGATDEACGIYELGDAGVDLEAQVGSTSDLLFAGDIDSGLDFSIGNGTGATNPLVLTMERVGTDACNSDWFTASESVPAALQNSTDVATLATIDNADVRDYTEYPVDNAAAGSRPDCTFSLDYEISIPEDLVPLGTGTYTFTGPTIEIRLVNTPAS